MASSKNNRIDVEVALKKWLTNAQKVVIVGVGNSLRRDDFVGIEIVRGLHSNVSQSVYLIECETFPEVFLEPITVFKPTHILIIDAAMLSLDPGSSKLIDPDQIPKYSTVSTHTLPLRFFCEYLAKTTGAKIALLVIQPGDTSLGEGLTLKLVEKARKLTDLLSKILP